MNRIFASSGRSLLFRARAWGNVQPRMLQPSLTSASLSPATSQSPLQHQSIRRYQEQQNDANSNRVYSQLAFYKNETCLSVDPVAPNIIHREKYFQLKKPGTLILSFASSMGQRFDWENKVSMALDIYEIGQILAKEKSGKDYTIRLQRRAFNNNNNGGDFYSQQSSSYNQKHLMLERVTPTEAQHDPFYRFTIQMEMEAELAGDKRPEPQSRKVIVLTEGEFMVLARMMDHSLPGLLAWHDAMAPRIAFEGQQGQY